jgi:hypothetical protein
MTLRILPAAIVLLLFCSLGAFAANNCMFNTVGTTMTLTKTA